MGKRLRKRNRKELTPLGAVKKLKNDVLELPVAPDREKDQQICSDGTDMLYASSDNIENNATNCSPLTLQEADVPELAGLTSGNELSIMKAEIFDPAYDIHQMMAASTDDNTLFLSGIDAVNCLSLGMDSDNGFKTASLVKTERTLDNFGVPLNRSLSTGTGDVFCMFDGSTAVESVLCPSMNIGAMSSSETGAHTSKMDAGDDDKGYIVHLNTSEGNFTVSMDGLMVSQAWLDKETAEDTQVITHGCSVGKTEHGNDTGNPDSGQQDVCSKQLPACGNGSEMQMIKALVPYDERDEANSKLSGRLLDAGLMSHHDGSGIAHNSLASSDLSDRGNRKNDDTDVADDANPSQVLVDIERFVICSDGPMKCLLCSFNTDNYSTFKSHIICSHPCWRITKKLSKNRLLVEKSARMSFTTSTVFPQPESPRVNSASPVSLTPKAAASRRSKKAKESHQVAQQLSKLCQQQQNARSRQLTQRNKRIFRCGKCQRLFVFEGSIVNHLLDYHDVRKPYKYIEVSNDHGETFSVIHRCMQRNCFVSCSSQLELEKHTHEAHDLVFRCQICGFCADSTESVERHVLNIHNLQLMMYGLTE